MNKEQIILLIGIAIGVLVFLVNNYGKKKKYIVCVRTVTRYVEKDTGDVVGGTYGEPYKHHFTGDEISEIEIEKIIKGE